MGRGQGFGASSPGLWASFDPVGYSLRTSVLCELEGLTGCALTWRLKDTPSGRLWWVLGRLGPRTDGSGSGSWPTAHGMDNDGNPRRNGPTGNELGRAVTREDWATPNTLTGGQTSRGGDRKGELLLVGQVRRSCPTPTQDDAGGRSTRYKQGGTSLSAQLQGSAWPTPTAQDQVGSGAAGYSTESGRHPGTTLTDAANGLWASPSSTDWKGSVQGDTLKRRREMTRGVRLPEQLARAGLLDQGSHSTSGKSRDWQTPQRRDGDLRGAQPISERRAQGHGSTLPDQLAEVTDHAERVRLGLRRLTRDGERWTDELEPPEPRGVLNSRWVAQLMGYPPDWCDLPAEEIERLSKPTGTRSCRRLSRESAGRSSRRRSKHERLPPRG